VVEVPSREKAFPSLQPALGGFPLPLPAGTAERTVDGLWTAIARLLDVFTPEECTNYFAAAGYDAD